MVPREPNPKNRVFAARLKALIEESEGCNQTDLAQRLGISRSNISMYLNMTTLPTNEKLIKIAEYFGVSPVWLMGADVEKIEQTTSVTDANAKWLMDKIAKAGPEEAAMMRRLYEAVDKERFND